MSVQAEESFLLEEYSSDAPLKDLIGLWISMFPSTLTVRNEQQLELILWFLHFRGDRPAAWWFVWLGTIRLRSCLPRPYFAEWRERRCLHWTKQYVYVLHCFLMFWREQHASGGYMCSSSHCSTISPVTILISCSVPFQYSQLSLFTDALNSCSLRYWLFLCLSGIHWPCLSFPSRLSSPFRGS